jgi:hypothetical protein
MPGPALLLFANIPGVRGLAPGSASSSAKGDRHG